MATKGEELDDAHRDRLIDVPLPTTGDGIFEDLHGFANQAQLTKRLIELALEHHGVASVRFLERLTESRTRNPESLLNQLAGSREHYLIFARKLPSLGRDLTRIHGKFATIYAAGALAHTYGLLPRGVGKLKAALLACERAHIEHVANFTQATGSLVYKLCEYIRAHEQRFMDLRKGLAPPDHDVRACPGYINDHAGTKEYLLTRERLAAVVGGKENAQQLKRDLSEQGFLIKTKAGDQGDRFVSKRRLVQGKGRQSVIALKATVIGA